MYVPVAMQEKKDRDNDILLASGKVRVRRVGLGLVVVHIFMVLLLFSSVDHSLHCIVRMMIYLSFVTVRIRMGSH
jgi:hypothetical protein